MRTSEAQENNNLYKLKALIFPVKIDQTLENRETLLIILNKGKDKVISLQAEAEGRVELYICSPSGPSRPILGPTLTLPRIILNPQVSTVKFVFTHANCNSNPTNHYQFKVQPDRY